MGEDHIFDAYLDNNPLKLREITKKRLKMHINLKIMLNSEW